MTTAENKIVMAKKFTDYLTSEDIIELAGESRAKAFTELVACAAQKRGVEPEDVFAAIMAREKIMSTAIGEGVAIPHGRMANLGEPLVIVGRCREPIADYHALDGKPVTLVILVLVDWNDSDVHLELLSSIAKTFLQKSKTGEQIMACNNHGDIIKLLS